MKSYKIKKRFLSNSCNCLFIALEKYNPRKILVTLTALINAIFASSLATIRVVKDEIVQLKREYNFRVHT